MTVKSEIDNKEIRKFGLLLGSTIAIILGGLPLIYKGSLVLWPWLLGIGIILWVNISPFTFKFIYKIWIRIGIILGWINTRIVLGIVYFLLLTPMSLIFRLIKRNNLNLGFDRRSNTYRIVSDESYSNRLEETF